jgi:hypothetical protein
VLRSACGGGRRVDAEPAAESMREREREGRGREVDGRGPARGPSALRDIASGGVRPSQRLNGRRVGVGWGEGS